MYNKNRNLLKREMIRLKDWTSFYILKMWYQFYTIWISTFILYSKRKIGRKVFYTNNFQIILFQTRNKLFQFKHKRLNQKKYISCWNPAFNRIFKDYWRKNSIIFQIWYSSEAYQNIKVLSPTNFYPYYFYLMLMNN